MNQIVKKVDQENSGGPSLNLLMMTNYIIGEPK